MEEKNNNDIFVTKAVIHINCIFTRIRMLENVFPIFFFCSVPCISRNIIPRPTRIQHACACTDKPYFSLSEELLKYMFGRDKKKNVLFGTYCRDYVLNAIPRTLLFSIPRSLLHQSTSGYVTRPMRQNQSHVALREDCAINDKHRYIGKYDFNSTDLMDVFLLEKWLNK